MNERLTDLRVCLPPAPLNREFYRANPRIVARRLLGQVLVSEIGGRRTSGIIVEAEGYLAAGDSACHASRGRTPKTEVMFGPPGMAYVYPIHAKWCFNVVTEREGKPSAVLIRAIEPLLGIDAMFTRRRAEAFRDLARGPARLCQAMGIDRAVNGIDLTRGEGVWIEAAGERPSPDRIRVTRRIGVTSAHDLPLRFALVGSSFVSGPKSLR